MIRNEYIFRKEPLNIIGILRNIKISQKNMFFFEKMIFSYYLKISSFSNCRNCIKRKCFALKNWIFHIFENFMIFQNFDIFSKWKVLLWQIENFIFFENFIIFSTFWWRVTLVVNQGLVEHQSWYSHKIKLQYNINDLNVTNQ